MRSMQQYVTDLILPDTSWARTAEDWAGHIAGDLARGVLATALFAGLLRHEVTLSATLTHVREATLEEARELRMVAGDDLYVREGALMAGTTVCARTVLRLIPHRVVKLAGPGAWAAVRIGRPCGDALAPYGLRPAARDIGVRPGQDPCVTARRLLDLRGGRAGLAAEEVPWALCQRLADPGRA